MKHDKNNIDVLDFDNLDFDKLDQMQAPGHAEIEKVEASFSDLPTVLDKIVQNMKAQQDKLDNQASLLYPYQNIEDEKHLKAARSDVRDVNKVLKEVKEMRLNTTRPLDSFKKELIQVENQITEHLSEEIDRVKSLCDAFEVEQERKRQEERRRIKREQSLEILRIRTKTEIQKSLADRVDEKVSELDESIQRNILSWTMDTFEKNLNQLKSLKPKFPARDWNGCFGVHPSSEESEFVTIDDCEVILQEMKQDELLSYELTQVKYERKGQDAINSHLVRMDEYKQEIAAIEKKRKESAEEARKLSELRRQKAEAESNARRKRLEAEARERAEIAEARQKQFEAEARMNALAKEQEVGGKEVNSRLITASATPTGYLSLLRYYFRTGGDYEKLNFLIAHAIRNGRPKLDGVTYNI